MLCSSMPLFRRPPVECTGVLPVGVAWAAVVVAWAAWTCSSIVLAAPVRVAAFDVQNPQATPAGSTSSNFTIFLRTVPIGSETVAVDRTVDGWTITSSGRADVPIDVVAREVRVRYTSDWKPIDLTIDATIRGQAITGRTTIEGATAHNVFTQAGQASERTDPIASDAVLLAQPLWGPFEALSQRLRTTPPGTTLPAYTLGTSLPIQVGASSDETLQMGARTTRARRTAIILMASSGPVTADVWADENGRLMRVSLPAQNIEVVRDDIASVAVRHVVVSRPGDQEIRIPANGFRLAGTISKPANAGNTPLPVVILVGGSEPTDRDETVYGISIFGQLAGVLADAGFRVLRYDKRAVGQSGGRAEAATVEDFADDLLAVVAAVRRMPAVDRRRIAVVGYGEGGVVALLAAAAQKDITALALLSSMGTTGAELNMWQVTHGLERSTRTAAEKDATVDLQKRIQRAVVTGSGWDTIAPQYRQQADNPWFKSFLTFDPAKVMTRVSQPLLIVHGLLDAQMPPSSADRLEELGRRRKNGSVDVARIPGVNHLLVPATTGEPDEYGALTDKQISAVVGRALVDWLQKTFTAAR